MSSDEVTVERPHLGVLAVIVLAVLGGLGWYVYSHWGTRTQELRWPDGSMRRRSIVRPHPVQTWIEDGPYTTWFEGGVQMAEEGGMRNGSLHGKLIQYHLNGVKKSESTWEDGRMVGKPLQWDEQGDPEAIDPDAPPPRPVVF